MSCELLYENTGIHAITTNARYFKCLGFNVILTLHTYGHFITEMKKVIEGFRIPRESLKFVIDYCVYDRRQEIWNFSFLSIISFNMIAYIFSNSDFYS